MEAFIRAMERRHAEGQPLDRHSVASLLRLARRHRGRQAARGARPRGPRRPRRRSPTPAPPTARSRSLRRRALRRPARGRRARSSARCGRRPASRTRAYPETMYVDGLVGPRHRQHDAAADAARRRARGRGHRRDRAPTTRRADLERAARGRHRPRRRHRQAAARRHRRVRGRRWTSCSTASSPSARRSSPAGPPTIEADLPAELEQPVAERARDAPPSEDVVHRIWRRDGTLWAPEGTPEVDRPARLARHRREAARGASTSSSAFAAEVRDDGLHRRRAAGMGGSSLAPEVLPALVRPTQAALRLHVLDSTRPGRRSRAVLDAIDLDEDAVHRLLEVRRDDRAEVACSRTSTSAAAATARTSSRSPIRAPRWRSSPREHGFRARLPQRPGDRRALLARCRRSGSCPAALAGVDVRAVLEARRRSAMPRTAQLDASGNAGLWLGARSASSPASGRDKLTFVVDEPLSRFGLWAEQLVAESTGKQGRGILPIADEPLLDARRLRRRPRVPARARRRRRRRAPSDGRGAARRPATR